MIEPFVVVSFGFSYAVIIGYVIHLVRATRHLRKR